MYLPTWKRLYVQGFPTKIDEDLTCSLRRARAVDRTRFGAERGKKKYITRAFWVDRVKTVQTLRYLAKSHHSTPSIKISPLLAATSNLL